MCFSWIPPVKVVRRLPLFHAFAVLLTWNVMRVHAEATNSPVGVTVGAYYFDGWAGRHDEADDPNEPWATNAPTHLNRALAVNFADRMPPWGWRDDTVEIMERQIDLAADHELAFFSFCWYWHQRDGGIDVEAIREDPKNTGLELFLKAKNNSRMKFCLMVANHGDRFALKSAEAWKQAADFWMRYFTHPQYLKTQGKPLIIVFNADGGNRDGFAYMQKKIREAGLPGIAIAGYNFRKPRDPMPDFGYTHRTQYGCHARKGNEEHRYAELAEQNRQLWGAGSPGQPYIPVVTSGWDKRPWVGRWQIPHTWYYPDRTPEQFGALLNDAIRWMDTHPDQVTPERLMVIFAWNEYGEGGYIAPTRGDPEGGYLKALKSAIRPRH